MNWIVLTVIVFLILMAIRGYSQGFVRMLLSLFATVITTAVVWVASPVVKDILSDKTALPEIIQTKAEDMLQTMIEERLEKAEQEADVPEVLWERIEGLIKEGNRESLKTAAAYLTDLILSSIVYVGLFILVKLILQILIHSLNVFKRIPVLRQINCLLGLLVSLAEAVILLWVACLLVTVFARQETGMYILKEIGRSPFLSFLYGHNILLIWLLKFLT